MVEIAFSAFLHSGMGVTRDDRLTVIAMGKTTSLGSMSGVMPVTADSCHPHGFTAMTSIDQ
ncbi:hypothetical protein A2U01_0049332, partial [Trifolium medium]|nr:hypothetical protein [Trifolium medium]